MAVDRDLKLFFFYSSRDAAVATISLATASLTGRYPATRGALVQNS